MTRGLELNGRAIASRVKGRGALTKSLVGLLLRAHRFASQRARTRDDQVWAGRFIDALQEALRVARQGTPPPVPSLPRPAAAEGPLFDGTSELASGGRADAPGEPRR